MAKLKLKKQKTLKRKKVILIVGIIIAIVLSVAVLFALTKTDIIPSIQNGDQNSINRIYVAITPSKTVYLTNEAASYEGIVVCVVLNNGKTYNIDETECAFSGFDSSVVSECQTITVTYKGFTTTYDIVINKRPKIEKEPIKIELINTPKTEYQMSELLQGVNADGGILLVTYLDGTTDEVELDRNIVYGFMNIEDVGTYTLTIEYVEKNVKVTTTYTITVTE